MDKFVTDQAEGLRRLLARRPLRVVTLLGAQRGAGVTTAAINLAAGLCHHGKRALVIDEYAGTTDPVSGTTSFADIVEGRVLLEDAFAAHADHQSVTVLAAGDTRLDHLSGEQQIAALDGDADLVVIDARLDETGTLSPLAASAHDIVVVMGADATSLTGAYGLIKRLHFQHANQQFRLLFNRVAHPADAQGIYQNLSGVATRYLGISLTPAGVVSRDADRISRAAALGASVVAAFPSAPAAIDYRRIAADMLHWPWRPIPARPSTGSGMAMASESLTERLGLRGAHGANDAGGRGMASSSASSSMPNVSFDSNVRRGETAHTV